MSDTPRTDRAVAFDDDGYVVTASFARTLERELAEMTALRDSEMRWANQYKKERDELQKTLESIEEYGTQEINAAVELRQLLAKARVERDEARECLLEAMKHADHSLREDDALSPDTEHYPYHKHYWPMVQRWMKVSGIYHIPDAGKMEDKQ